MLRRLLLYFVLVHAACAQQDPNWTRPFPPFRIIGNVYWVGTWDLSSYLVTTPQGDILINTGLASTVPDIRANVEKLVFRCWTLKS